MAFSGGDDAQRRCVVSVLGPFALRMRPPGDRADDAEVDVPVSLTGRRVLALLALQQRYALALQCALAAVDGEPSRESAHRRVIEVQLAEDNVGEAIRQFRRCRQQLAEDLGIRPSRSLTELVAGAHRPPT
jgi:hypothetical protein